MLEKCLAETDPETTDRGRRRPRPARRRDPEGTDVVDAAPRMPTPEPTITDEDRRLLTAVVNLAEHAGKPVKPLIVPTNEPIAALVHAARALGATELILGPSDTEAPDDQLDQSPLLDQRLRGRPRPLTIRVLGKDRDTRRDIAGGSQIPPAPTTTMGRRHDRWPNRGRTWDRPEPPPRFRVAGPEFDRRSSLARGMDRVPPRRRPRSTLIPSEAWKIRHQEKWQ